MLWSLHQGKNLPTNENIRNGGESQLTPYRSSLQIMTQVLESTQYAGQEGIPITSLIRQSNISHSRLTSLTKNLISSGLINKIEYDGKNTFVITEKGILFLEEYEKFNNFANSFGLEL